MGIELSIARRMRLNDSGDGSRRSSTGSAIAVAGIAIAFVVMLLSVVIMLGFKNEIKAKIMGFDSEMIVYPPTSGATGVTETVITASDTLDRLLCSVLPPEARVGLNITAPVIFKTPDDFQGMILRGFNTADSASFIAGNLIEGRIPDLDADSTMNQIVIPSFMSGRLNLSTGDKVQAFFIDNGNVKVRNMTISGVYDTHFSDYDKVYAFARTDFLQKVKSLSPRQGSSIAIDNLGTDDDIDRLTGSLQTAIYDMAISQPGTPVYQVRNIHQTGAAYFSWLSLLDTNVVVILVLMAVVSGFTLVSSLFIIILERVNMIGILKALGMSTWSVVKIFIYVAERLVLRGLLAGNLLAGIIIYLQARWHLIPLDPDNYYLSYVPVCPDLLWWIALNIAVIVMAALVLVLPARMISGIKPSTAIKYD